MRLPKLTRRGRTLRNFVLIAALLFLLWGADGFRSLTPEQAVRREAARYFAQSGAIVLEANGGETVVTCRDGILHAYQLAGGLLWEAEYRGAFPIVDGTCTIELTAWSPEQGFEECTHTVAGEPVTVWVERSR